jgi:predicted ATPase
MGKGLTYRPAPDEFANQMFDIDLKSYINNIGTNKLLFFDRSCLDSAALLVETVDTYDHNLTEIVTTFRFNKDVFIAPPWKEIYYNDDGRDQSYEDTVEIYEKLRNWYPLNGYTLLSIPKTNIDIRTRFVLESVNLTH